jgi:hypothetical protein
VLEDVAQRAARGDPDLLQRLGPVVVLDRLGPQAVDRYQRPVDGASFQPPD